MRICTLVLIASAAMAETKMLPIPDSLKNPAQLRRGKPMMPKQIVVAEPPAAATCSVPLTRVPLRDDGAVRVIRPETSSNMPVIAPPAPPCDAEKR